MNSTPAGTATAMPIDVAAKLHELARAKPRPAPVISVYLATRWSDEHQRDRVRVFLKNEIRKAAAKAGGQFAAELAWLTAEAERLVGQESPPGASSPRSTR